MSLSFLYGALLLIPFLIPMPVSLERQLLYRSLGNQLHVVLFFGLTLLLYDHGWLRGRLLAAAGLAAVIGAAVEPIQELCGRHARWQDFALDLVGIGLAMCWIQWRRRRSRWALAAGLLLLLVIPVRLHNLPSRLAAERHAAQRFPLLADFENGWEENLWNTNDDGVIELTTAGDVGSEGDHRNSDYKDGRVLRLQGDPPSHYPGAEMRGFSRDWSDYRYLEFDARVLTSPTDSVKVVLRVDDFHGREEGLWATARFYLGHAWQRVTIDLHRLRTNKETRPFRLHDMDMLLIYLPFPAETTVVELDNLRLTGSGSDSTGTTSPAS